MNLKIVLLCGDRLGLTLSHAVERTLMDWGITDITHLDIQQPQTLTEVMQVQIKNCDYFLILLTQDTIPQRKPDDLFFTLITEAISHLRPIISLLDTTFPPNNFQKYFPIGFSQIIINCPQIEITPRYFVYAMDGLKKHFTEDDNNVRDKNADAKQLVEKAKNNPYIHVRVALYAKATRLDASYAYAFQQHAVQLRNLNLFDRALEQINLAINLEPNNADLYITRGKTHVLNNMADQGFIDFEKALQIDPGNIDALLQRGSGTDNLELAIQDLTAVLDAEPNNFIARSIRAVVWLQREETDRALEDWQQLLQTPNKNSVMSYTPATMARYFLDRQNNISATAFYTQALWFDQTNIYSYVGLGNVLENLEDYEKALQQLDFAIFLAPREKWLLEEKGNFLLRKAIREMNQGDFEKALATVNKADTFLPETAEIHYVRGNCLTMLKLYKEALRSLKLAIDAQYPNSRIYYLAAIAYAHTNHVTEALDSIQTYFRETPEEALADNARLVLNEIQQAHAKQQQGADAS